jgi:hypothetical protein
MSLTEECGLVDVLDANPDYVPEPAKRCTCCLRRGVRLLCQRCEADRDWRRWVAEATARQRGEWMA